MAGQLCQLDAEGQRLVVVTLDLEIEVERVKFLRYGEARGDYAQVVETLNASDPHGR
jgi:hypothetical protein